MGVSSEHLRSNYHVDETLKCVNVLSLIFSVSAFCHMLSFGVLLSFDNITIAHSSVGGLFDKSPINDFKTYDKCTLNPDAEPFIPYTLTSLYKPSVQVISKYNDNICIDNFNCSNSDTIFMRGTCPNTVQALAIFPQLMSLSAFSFMISIAIFLNLKEVCINNIDNNSIVSET